MPSLFASASLLERLSFDIDNGGEIGEGVIKEFQDLRTNVSDSVDRAIYFRHALRASIAQTEEVRDEWVAKVKHLKRMEESFNNYALACVRSVGFPLKGSQGALTSQKNPPAVNWLVPLDSKSYSNILSPNLEYHIPEKYLDKVEFFRINSEAVKNDLKEGVICGIDAGRASSLETITEGSH